MLAIDTNLIVRYLVGDDPGQAARARRLIDNNDVFVCTTVLLETEWVLRYSYGLSTTAIAKSFLALLGLPTVTVEDVPAVHLAIRMLEHGIDFADALHLASSANVERFVTLDAKLVKRARKVAPLPVALA